VQLGSGAEIYRNPATRYVADFIGEANLITCRVDANGAVQITANGPGSPYRTPANGARQVSLMVRPESVRLGGAAGADHVALPAKLKDKVFVGSTYRLYLVIADGQEIAAEPGCSSAVDALAPGDTVWVHWHKDAARVLED
jgi:spermidine/putrescine transport system ATP-binding protein